MKIDLYTAGKRVPDAKAAMVLIHGRGATAPDILDLTHEFGHRDYAYIAPQADGNTWYPNSFLAPIASNEPGITNGLATIDATLQRINAAGIPSTKIIILGFSQGACLSTEFIARNANRYGGLVALSGGLIGPDGTPRDYAGSLDGTPVFLGCSNVDPHVPLKRVQESTQVLQKLGGSVTERIYPGMGHTVNVDEIAFIQGMMAALLEDPV